MYLPVDLIIDNFVFVFRVLQNHNSFQPCTNSCIVCRMFNRLVSTNWW